MKLLYPIVLFFLSRFPRVGSRVRNSQNFPGAVRCGAPLVFQIAGAVRCGAPMAFKIAGAVRCGAPKMKKSLVRTGAWNLNKFSIFQRDFYYFKDILSALEPNLDILRHFEAFLDESLPLIISKK